MSHNFPNKNATYDFTLKKDFIDLQFELKRFIDETDLFTLQDMLKDQLLVHDLEDYLNAYWELDEIKRIKKTIKRLMKLKKKNIDLTPALKKINEYKKREENVNEDDKISFPLVFNYENSLFGLKQIKPFKELNKEKMLQIFKTHMSRLEHIKKVQIQKPVVNRNMSVSSSHSNLLKKIDKGTDAVTKPAPKVGNEITTNASFRNGVLKNGVSGDKSTKQSIFGQPNIIKATRSPYQTFKNPESAEYPTENKSVAENKEKEQRNENFDLKKYKNE